jgi:polyferredoxin
MALASSNSSRSRAFAPPDSFRVDLLRQPLIGALIRWRHIRLALQCVLLVVAAAVVLHGLFGPQIAPRNLATVLTSIHWRGLLVIAVVAIGNLFCTACPMILARDAGRRFVHPRLRWPRQLRGKWLGLGLLVAVLFSYELFDLWEQPRATAWLVLGYFGIALLVDLLFTGATFCKHLCPIGQFNFVTSTCSPTTLQVREVATCRTCRTSDCIKGRPGQRGCELGLFLPVKAGNLDCTLCFDCVHACPHDNIALVSRVPGTEWLATGRRSAIGRLAQRPDIAALALVFVFAALLTAFAMTAPAAAAGRGLAAAMGLRTEAPALAALFVVGLVLLPAVLVAAAAAGTRLLSRVHTPLRTPLRKIAMPFVYALVPFGFGVWLAHYGFHLLTGVLTIVPVTQSAAIDLLGRAALGEPAWNWMGMRSGLVFPIQLGFVLLGTAGSLGLVRATSLRDHAARPWPASAPWMVLVMLLAAAAMWILAQPMEMRGMAAG